MGPSGVAPGPLADPPDGFTPVGEGHADQQADTDDNLLRLGLDGGLADGLLETADDRDREHDAHDRAAAAEDRYPAEQDDRDDVELETGAGVVTDRRVLQGEQDPGERAHHAGEDEQPELD